MWSLKLSMLAFYLRLTVRLEAHLFTVAIGAHALGRTAWASGIAIPSMLGSVWSSQPFSSA